MEKIEQSIKIELKKGNIAASAFVAANATLIGRVHLAHETSVLFNAVLRADNEPIHVGEHSNIQDLACLHTDPGYPCILAKRVTVGHGAIVHGATIEDDVLVGMGAIVLTGAKIGRETILGAGTLVAENKVIPPRSVVLGVPGKIVRQVNDEDLANIHLAAQRYVEVNHQYRRKLIDRHYQLIAKNDCLEIQAEPRIIVREHAEAVALAAREWFIDCCQSAVQSRGRCLVALSGGATPKRLYELLADLPQGVIPWSKVVLFWGDERSVPANHPDSNYRMIRNAMLDRLEGSPPKVHPVPIEGFDASTSARLYEATLREYAQGNELNLDITLLGLGDDAHTASLFPATEAIHVSDRWVVANDVPKMKTTRITMTAPLLNQSRNIAFLVCGANKQWALSKIFGLERDPVQFPAQLIQPIGQLRWFIDSAANETLNK